MRSTPGPPPNTRTRRILPALVLGLSLAVSCVQVAQVYGEQGEALPDPVGATTTDPPAGMIRLGSGELVTLSRRTNNPGATAMVFSRWAGAGAVNSGIGADPPDPHGAVGPFGVLQVVNSLAIYSTRAGEVLWKVGLFAEPSPKFFEASGLDGVDPKAIFDTGSGRFYFIMFERYGSPNRSFLDLAVSKSPHPITSGSADWYFYRFDTIEHSGGSDYGADYPCLGFDGQAIYVSCNMFSMPFDFFPSFKNCQILIFDKSKVTSGVSDIKRLDTPDGPSSAFTLQPATVVGAEVPENVAYFAEVSYITSTSSVRAWALTDPLGTPMLSSVLLNVPNHGGQIDGAPQPAPGSTINTLSGRAQCNAFWCSGSLWFCHTAGGSSGRSIVYYYRVSTNGYPVLTPTLTESGGIDGGPGVWNYMPAIGATAGGDVCLVFTQSSAVTSPRIMATARQSSADAFPAPIEVAASPTYYDGKFNPARWGDYAVVCADPSDSSFWVCHELAGPKLKDANDWATQWGNLVFPRLPSGWVADGMVLRKAPTGAMEATAVSDGAAGAFVGWSDGRTFPGAVYVLRLTPVGTLSPGWPYGGAPAGPPDGCDPVHVALVPDSSGGVFVCWASRRVHVQHLDASGTVAPGWPGDGLTLSTNAITPAPIAARADGAGGVYVGWSQAGIRVLRISSSGLSVWGGEVVLASSGAAPDLAPDGAGVIVAWNPGVRVQRLDSAGAAQWAAGGISIANGTGARVVSDGSGGAIVGFQKSGIGQDVYCTRITSVGVIAPGWQAGGVAVCSAPNDQVAPRIISDQSGGAVLVWVDYRHDPDGVAGDIWAQRITGAGLIAPGWPVNGASVCSASGDQSAPGVVADGAGGALIVWQDTRTGGMDIYAQHFSAEGVPDPTFPEDGESICGAPGPQRQPAIVNTEPGASVVVWEDGRTYAECNPFCTTAIYAQRIPFDGVAPAAVTDLAAAAGRHRVVLRWSETGDDGLAGAASEFDVRYSTSPISDDNFGSAARLAASTPIGVAGTETCLEVGLPDCATYFFAMKTYDDARNASPISNLGSASTLCGGDIEPTCGPGVAGMGISADPSKHDTGVPTDAWLSSPRPNPTTEGCVLDFGIPASLAGASIDLSFFDVTGRRISTLLHDARSPGMYSARWNLRSSDGARVRAGIYFARLSVGPTNLVQIVLARP